jgi:hypothetical protein
MPQQINHKNQSDQSNHQIQVKKEKKEKKTKWVVVEALGKTSGEDFNF